MKNLLKFFIDNAVATNLVMLAILILGVTTMQSTRIEAFPKVPASTITITTIYAGASAKQMDELVTQKIEKHLDGVRGIKKIYSLSQEGISMVTVEKKFSADVLRLKERLKSRLDEVYDFPLKMQRPIFSIDEYSMTAMYITLSGKSDATTLEYFGDKVRKELLHLPQISKIDTWGSSVPEFSITFDVMKLEQFNLSLDDAILKLQEQLQKNLDGYISRDGRTVSVEVSEEMGNIEALQNIVLFFLPSKKPIRLKELASVVYGFEKEYIVPTFDNEVAYGMEVKIRGNESVIEIAQVLKEKITKLDKTLPSNLKLTYWGDSSTYISNRLSLLNTNALQGILIVFILLALFLNIKLAFWVAMGIPISLAGSVAILGSPWMDYSVNDITTLGMILSLGLLVDDAIIIGESVFSQRKKKKDAKKATILGVQRVATATIFGALTTVAAFIPMFLIQDELIKILTSFSIVIIITLSVSLFESKILLPAHLAHISRYEVKHSNLLSHTWYKIQSFAQNLLRYMNYKLYTPVLKFSLRHRYSVFILIISLGVIGLGLLFNGTVKTLFYPEIPQQSIQMSLEMDSQASTSLTKSHVLHINQVIKKLNAQWKKEFHLADNPMRHVFMQIEALKVEVYIELSASQKREVLDTLDILKELKNRIGVLEAAQSIEYSATDSFAGKFQINIYAEDEQTLKKASRDLKETIENIKGVSQVYSSLEAILPVLKVTLKPMAYKLGFTKEHFAQQISHFFSDTQVGKVIHNNKESKVIVKLLEDQKDSLYDLLNIKVQNSDGKWFKLMSIANITSRNSVQSISKMNNQKVATISVVLDKNFLSSSKLQEILLSSSLKDIKERYIGVSFDEAGELEAIGVAKKSLNKTLIITMVLIYLLLAIPLKSYGQPFIIMSVIPFGFIGSMIGHMIEGYTFSIFSFLGILALTGIVVNDSLVMMTQYNQKRAQNLSVNLAIKIASVGRFRAIFLTTITTVLGLMPLISETSENAQYLIPSAISIAYGEIFATILTLILVPVLIVIQEDIKKKIAP